MTRTPTKRLKRAVLAALFFTTGCGGLSSAEESAAEVAGEQRALMNHGEFLFRQETFGGNGRTCETCHSLATGTVSPADLQARYQQDPNEPMFRALDSDDGTSGASYQRLLEHATILVSVPLPSNTQILLSSATQVTLRRGIPSTIDTPALDPVLMLDGREPSLTSQAHSAIMGHAQAARQPTVGELEQIASFEQTLFSSQELEDYAQTGVPPPLPAGNTDSEKRGRAFFLPQGACGQCHSGPLLNETGAPNYLGQPVGSRFSNILISEINLPQNPVYSFVIRRPDGLSEVRTSPDPGRFLITGRLEDFNMFKMGSLRNIKNTAPYFHDNAAKTLAEVVDHYTLMLLTTQGTVLSDQDKADILAYLNLL